MKEKATQQNMLELLKKYQYSLTQSQGEEREHQSAIAYDFKKPKKFTKDQFNSLNSIYESYTSQLGLYISGVLRSFCDAELVSIEERDYNNISDNSTFFASANLNFPNEKLMPAQMYIELSKDLSFSILDKMLGGDGTFFSIARDYTNFELGILDNFIGNIVSLMKEPWANFIDIEPSYLRNETNFYLIKGLAASDNAFIEIKIKIEIKNISGTLRLLIPSIALEGIFKCIYKRNSRESSYKGQAFYMEECPELFESIKDTQLEITGVLGQTAITVNDLVMLSEGDLIQLDHNNLEVTLCVDDMPWFKATYLTKTKYKSLKIHNIIL